MGMTLVLHIVAGGLGLASGFVALYAAKGAGLHRKSGMVFVYAMLTMAAAGTVIAAVRGVAPGMNVPAGLTTLYLVTTGLATVRRPSAAARWLDGAALLLALGVGLTCLAFGAQAVANGGTRNGMPAFPCFLFGLVCLLGSAGDVRMIRSGPRRGNARLARHLWRMCFALFIAALSFFIGQAKVIPEPLRIPGLLALPPLGVLGTMFYWLWRVRARPVRRAVAAVPAQEAA